MKISRHALGPALVVSILFVALCVLEFYIAAAVPLLLLLFVLYFFRDPERSVTKRADAIISPADGAVTEITDVQSHELLGNEGYLKIGIFLALYNVHINRAPVKGKIERIVYKKGEFVTAMREDSSHINEANNVVMRMEDGTPLLLRQIAGVAARRIVFDKQIGDLAEQGERVGLIKFGSRTEVFIPKAKVKEVVVKLGDRVEGAVHILALLNQ